MNDFPAGMVWLVGASPGDPELLTRKAERRIGLASVVFHDALVGPGVLAMAAPGAGLVHVGKRSGRHSKDQGIIVRLIVEAALTGERVVRLKGCDPAIFGRATEELVACHTAGVPVRLCPGVTAARRQRLPFRANSSRRGCPPRRLWHWANPPACRRNASSIQGSICCRWWRARRSAMGRHSSLSAKCLAR